MAGNELNLKPGKWVVVDCGKMPSESNCQLIMATPENQKEDLVSTGVKHAVSKHGHSESEDLKSGVESMCETIEVA